MSTNTSHLETNAGFFRFSMSGKFDGYLLWPFGKIKHKNLQYYGKTATPQSESRDCSERLFVSPSSSSS